MQEPAVPPPWATPFSKGGRFLEGGFAPLLPTPPFPSQGKGVRGIGCKDEITTSYVTIYSFTLTVRRLQCIIEDNRGNKA